MARNRSITKRTLLDYQLIRNTTSPDETQTGVRSFVVNLPVFEILKLDTKDNLRDYIAEYNPRKRNSVHRSIRSTIDMTPERFITRNSGFVIAASDINVDDKKKTVSLENASILNGAQSQGEIQQWVNESYEDPEEITSCESPFFIRAEIIVDPDSAQIVETAIARNTATPVKSISQAGARGQLDDLQKSIHARWPNRNIRQSETDADAYDTRKILQYTRLLMPEHVAKNNSPAERLRAYKNPEQCLTEFSKWYGEKDSVEESRLKYEFTVQIAPYALEEYEHWEKHEAWNGHRIWKDTKKGGRACRREKITNKVVWISPGIVFPIISALSEFVEQDSSGQWRIEKPKLFKEDEMVSRAVQQFRGQESDPMQMGRSAGVYDALRIYPATLIEVMRDSLLVS